MPTAEEIIRKFGLEPLPGEGGYYYETYRSKLELSSECLPDDYSGSRAMSTAIYYLLTPDGVSSMHRVPGDEIFHFYLGDPVDQLMLYPDGHSQIVTLGSDFERGQQFQSVVPGGVWQGAWLKDGGQFALLGTTMAPGFEFSDYESGNREQLISEYPSARQFIERLTQNP